MMISLKKSTFLSVVGLSVLTMVQPFIVKPLRAETPKIPEITRQEKIEPKAMTILKGMSKKSDTAGSRTNVSIDPIVKATPQEDSQSTTPQTNQFDSVTIGEGAIDESSSFNAQVSNSAHDLLPEELRLKGFMTAQTESSPESDFVDESKGTTSDMASTTPTVSVEELAKKAQNPIANLISLPFQNNTNFGVGPLNRTQNIFNIQPVVPLSINKNLLLITRTIVPFVYQPEPPQGGGGNFGLGDINPQFYFSPKGDSNITWGVGPSFVLPTATDSVLGQGKWSIGPAAVIVVTTKHVVFGAVGNNIWSFAGNGHRPGVSQLTFQPFVNYNLNDGWYLVSAPILTANWYGSGGNQWTVPLGGGFGRVFALGKQRVNASLQAYWNVAKPEGGVDWTVRTQFQLLFPK